MNNEGLQKDKEKPKIEEEQKNEESKIGEEQKNDVPKKEEEQKNKEIEDNTLYRVRISLVRIYPEYLYKVDTLM